MKSDKKLNEKAKKILSCARREFADKGFHEASVDAIAENAEVGKGTVYRNFGSKESLFLEVSRLTFTELIESLESEIDKKTFKEAVLELLNAVVNHHYENRSVIQIIFHYISKMLADPEWRERFTKFSGYEFETLKKIVRTAMERGEIDQIYEIEDIAIILRDFASSIPKKILFFDYPKEKLIQGNEILVDILSKGMKRS